MANEPTRPFLRHCCIAVFTVKTNGGGSAGRVGTSLPSALAGVAAGHQGQTGGGGVWHHHSGERVLGQHRTARRRDGGRASGLPHRLGTRTRRGGCRRCLARGIVTAAAIAPDLLFKPVLSKRQALGPLPCAPWDLRSAAAASCDVENSSTLHQEYVIERGGV